MAFSIRKIRDVGVWVTADEMNMPQYGLKETAVYAVYSKTVDHGAKSFELMDAHSQRTFVAHQDSLSNETEKSPITEITAEKALQKYGIERISRIQINILKIPAGLDVSEKAFSNLFLAHYRSLLCEALEPSFPQEILQLMCAYFSTSFKVKTGYAYPPFALEAPFLKAVSDLRLAEEAERQNEAAVAVVK